MRTPVAFHDPKRLTAWIPELHPSHPSHKPREPTGIIGARSGRGAPLGLFSFPCVCALAQVNSWFNYGCGIHYGDRLTTVGRQVGLQIARSPALQRVGAMLWPCVETKARVKRPGPNPQPSTLNLTQPRKNTEESSCWQASVVLRHLAATFIICIWQACDDKHSNKDRRYPWICLSVCGIH